MQSKTLLKKREGILCSLITEEDQTIIHFAEEEIRGPAHIEPILQHIIDNTHFSISSLPDSLTESGKQVLVNPGLKAWD